MALYSFDCYHAEYNIAQGNKNMHTLCLHAYCILHKYYSFRRS